MSLLRRGILSVLACCVALAVGIALGAGPLQGDADADAEDSAADNSRLGDQVTALQQGQAFSEAVAAASAPRWLSGRLDGASVTLVVLPGVADGVAEDYRATVAAAGGSVVVSAGISPDYVDSIKKTYVDSVAHSSLHGLTDLRKLADAEPYTQIAALVARAYVGRADALTVDDEATRIDSELQGARLVSLADDLQRRGSLVVVLAGGEHGGDDDTQAQHLIEVELVKGLAEAGDGVVVVAPPTAGLDGGLLRALSPDELAALPVATLDVQAGTDARTAAVYALQAAANGDGGDFGVDGSDVVLPPGMTAPTP